MRQKRVWRYYCDHCKKGGCGKAAMIKHELHCIKNPDRKCRMCDAGEVNQQPMAELTRAYVEDGLQGLRALAEGCPACMLSTIVQYRITPESGYDPDESEEFFDYKAESVSWWSDVNDNKREWAGYA